MGCEVIETGSSSGTLRAQIEALPFWRGPVALRPLVGGLCNDNFVAQDISGSYVVRCGRDIPIHGIFQGFVQTAMNAATEIGVTPALRYATPNISVIDFVEGRHLQSEDIRNEAILAALVGRIRKLHDGGEAIRGSLTYFWPFQVVRQYVRYCLENGARQKDELEVLGDHAAALERLVSPFRPTFTHNDLAPQNIMLNERGQVLLIDWDYGAYGHPLFDLAAITANADDCDEVEPKILNLYAGGSHYELWKQFRLFKLIVNLRETLWGAVQEIASPLKQEIVQAGMASIYPDQEQGYAGYTELNRKRFYRNFSQFKSLYG